MTVMTRTHTTILAITGIFGGDVLAASVVRRRRQATMLAMVTPFAEDHFPGKFGEGFARHQCHVQPDDASQQPFQAACPAMFISAYDTRHMELSLRADTVDDDEPVVVNAVPADGGNKLETAADVSGGGHCVMPHADGNSCAGRTILHMRLQFDDDGPDYCDEACVHETMWTATAADGSALNADGLFRASSYGQAYFNEARSRVVTVNIPGKINAYAAGFSGASPSTGCPYRSLMNLAKHHLPSNVTSDDFQHHAFWVPTNSVLGCTWGGLAAVRGRESLYRSRGVGGGLLAHELGHNLGLGHSGTDANDDGIIEDEYGDRGGVMGAAFNGPPGFTAPHRMILGWITDGHGLSREPALSCAAHHELQITLSRLDRTPTTASHINPHGKTMVTFPRTSWGNRYYLSFYSENDVNGKRIDASWRNQVHVHTHTGAGFEHTKHVAKLSQLGPAFRGSSMGEAFEITVLSIGEDSATVKLSLTRCTANGWTWNDTARTRTPSQGPTQQAPTPAPSIALIYRGEIQCGERIAGDTSSPGISMRGGDSPEHTFSFVAGADFAGRGYNISTCGSSFDTYLRIFDSAGAEVAGCDDCGGCSTRAAINVAGLTAGDTYTILVEGYSDHAGAYELSVTAGGGSEPTFEPTPGPISAPLTSEPSPGPTPARRPPTSTPTSTPTATPTPAPTLIPTLSSTLSPSPALTRASDADYCPPGYVNSPKRYAMGMGRITIVHFDEECSNRCALYSGVRYNGGCKGYMTGMYFGMKFCRSYGGNAQTQRCASWANPLLDGQCCTREVVNMVPPL